MLNGLAIIAGISYVFTKDSNKKSAAIFEAAYGDCACNLWSSSIGVYNAVP